MMLWNSILFFIAVVWILFVCYIWIKDNTIYNKVPKKIWTYWDMDTHPILPKSILLCMESWKRHHPEYEIVLLTKKNLQGYVRIPSEVNQHPLFHDIPSRYKELVSLYVLAEHGGIWMDPTVFVKKPFDEWLFTTYAEFSGYDWRKHMKDPHYPVIETRFMACNKNSAFLRLWRDEFIQIMRYPSVDQYIDSRVRGGVDVEGIVDPVERAVDVAAQKILQIDGYSLEHLLLRKAEEGPFRYLMDTHWNSEKALLYACGNPSLQSPLLILREEERKILDEKREGELSNERCGWV